VIFNRSLVPSSGVLSIAGLNAEGMIPGTELGSLVGDIYFSFFAPGTNEIATTDLVEFAIGDVGGDLDIFDIVQQVKVSLLCPHSSENMGANGALAAN
jgi:hypothetical protein